MFFKILYSNFVKRLFDILFSLFAILLLSPIMLTIAILIKIKSPEGPVFFSHKRVGQYGKTFKVYKFRTMVPDAEKILKEWLDKHPEIKAEYEKDFKLKNDPRIIPGIGEFLRKYSLDELPQFFNSLIGNMSVVGPRPIVESEKEKYGKYVEKLLSVKPGITGLWQVSGRNDISYDERVEIDMNYIDNMSFWLDLKIIFKTVYVMLFGKGAY
ncbi:MAG: sugar transferase [Nitrososphaeria archaeon]